MKIRNKTIQRVQRTNEEFDNQVKNSLFEKTCLLEDEVLISESSDNVYEIPEETILDNEVSSGDVLYIFENYGLGANAYSKFNDDFEHKQREAVERFVSFFRSLSVFKFQNEKYYFIADSLYLFKQQTILEIIKEHELYNFIYLDKASLNESVKEFIPDEILSQVNICDDFDFIENIRFASKVITL